MTETKKEKFEDYLIHYTDHVYYMDFKVYEITGYIQNEITGEFNILSFDQHWDETDETKVDPFWEGSIEWDGCSNWDFKTGNCMAHFCGKKMATSIGRLMEKLYDIASTMPKFDKDLAE